MSLADTTISGLASTSDGDSFQIREDGSGQIYEVELNYHGGSVCGEWRAFGQAMAKVVGHEVQLTGVFETLYNGDEEFNANLDGIQILEN